MEDANNNNNNNAPPPPPPPPPAHQVVLTTSADSLTSASLIAIQLEHVDVEEEPKGPLAADDIQSALELAVRRRAEKFNPGVLESAPALYKRLEEIRYLLTYEEQKALVLEARSVELELEKGGPMAVARAKFPTYDVANMFRLVKQEEECASVMGLARRAMAEGRLEAAESVVQQLEQLKGIVRDIRRTNNERFGLRIDVDAVESSARDMSLEILRRLFEDGFQRVDQLAAKPRSRFGLQYSSAKSLGSLKVACALAKKLKDAVMAAPEELRTNIRESEARAKELLTAPAEAEKGSLRKMPTPQQLLERSSSSGSVGNSSSDAPPRALDQSFEARLTSGTVTEEDLGARDRYGNTGVFLSAMQGKVEACRTLLELPFIRLDDVNPITGQNVLHVAAAAVLPIFLSAVVNRGLESQLLTAEDRSRDTPLSALCKRVAASMKNRKEFLDALLAMISLAPAALHMVDANGRTPLATLSLKLSQRSAATAAPPTGRTSPDASAPATVGPSSSLLSFDRYCMSEKLSDVTFVLDSGDRVPAHRIVLCAQSSVLRSLLEDSVFAEANLREIPLPEVETDELALVLHYMYCGLGPLNWKKEATAVGAIFLADRWLLPHLVKHLCSMLQKQVALENCFMLTEELACVANGCAAENVASLRTAAASRCLRGYCDIMEHDASRNHLKEAIECLMGM